MLFDIDKKNLRSAEKARNSTCAFADLIASKCISKYRDIIEKNELLNNPGNTVIAGILIENPLRKSELELVALASGTKHGSNNPGLKDLHAEILVRRAFNRYIADRIIRNSNEKQHLQNLMVHFYVSSAPCGNACIRRWANPKKENWKDCSGLPEDKHPPLHGFAIKEGQFALTVKKERLLVDLDEQIDEKSSNNFNLPAGIFPYRKYPNLILSCSDKILIWNCIGLIKIPFSNYLPRLFITSITVGRKFARPHLSRAVCCRLANKFPTINHPNLLCSSVKLDEGGLDATEGAKFNEQEFVFTWCEGRDVEIIFSKNGLKYPDSSLSSFSTEYIGKELGNVSSNDSYTSFQLINLKKSLKDYLISVS